jgi:uncharacterized membrane protein YfcA
MDPAIVVFGLGVGVLVGMTGMGGGSLMTPLLILVFGVKTVTAVGTDIAYAAITKTVGGYKHLRQGTVDMRISTWMALGSVPASIGGVYVIQLLQDAAGDDFDNTILTLVAAALLLTGTATLGRTLFLPKLAESERQSADLTRRNKIAAVIIGAFVGFVLGLTSAGSGALIAVALIVFFRLVPQRVVGTDVFHAAILLWAASIAHVVAGNVDYELMANILIGSVPGVWVGSHLSVRIPTGWLRITLSVILVGAGLGLLSKAGAGIPPIVLAAFPTIAVAIAIVAQIRRRGRAAQAAAQAAAKADPGL